MPHVDGHKFVADISGHVGNKRKGSVGFVLQSIALSLLLLGLGSILFVCTCDAPSVQALTRHVGGIRLIAWTVQNASAHSEFQELAALTAGRLVRNSPANQDAFLKAGGVEALESLLCADWGETRSTAGVQAAAARALADAMTSNKAAKDAFSRQGGSEALVALAARGPSDRASGAAARALVVLLEAPSPQQAQGLVLEAGGLEALATLLQGSPRSKAVADAVAALKVLLTGSPPAQAAFIAAGGIQALDLLVESGEPRVAASAAALLAQVDPKDFATLPKDRLVKSGEAKAACDTAEAA